MPMVNSIAALDTALANNVPAAMPSTEPGISTFRFQALQARR